MLSFVETKQFTRLVQEYLTDDDYAALQASLIADPALGVVIPGSGAVRKLRWPASGRGKISAHMLRQIRMEPERD